jgi:competence protein ComEC
MIQRALSSQMIRWVPYTFVRITLFLIAGILAGLFFPSLIQPEILQPLLLGVTLIYVVIFVVNRLHKKKTIDPGLIALPAIFLLGWLHAVSSDESKRANHLLNYSKPVDSYVATLTRFAEEKERSWKVEAHVNKIRSQQWENVHGKVILYFSKQDFKSPPKYGDVFLISGCPKVVDGPGNPGEFDYKRYLALRNIYHQHFVRAQKARLIGFGPNSSIVHYANRTRLWANETLKKYIPGTREQAVASALVLGVTDGLDNELLKAYAGTGAMHVLAVSGLHITIIYMIIAWILKPLSRFRSGPWIIALTSMIILWGYAFITGLSPSVLRAVTMFSFLALAKPTQQSTNMYNTLAASAFCILMFDPFLIMSVGFQLSYMAVIGIVYLHPKLYPMWEPEAWLLDEIWKITSVSIAAQIATLPLGLYYFHQFPNYFLISNLLVIPGSFVVLIGGLCILASSAIPMAATAAAFITVWMIKLINLIVFTVESFPFSLIDDIHLTTMQGWVLGAIILSLVALTALKQFGYVKLTFWFVLLFVAIQWNHVVDEVKVKRIMVYKIPGHTAIDLIDTGKSIFVGDSTLQADQLSFHAKPNRLNCGVTGISTEVSLVGRDFPGGRVLRWNDLTILQIRQKGFSLPDNFNFDFVIVSNNAIFDMRKIPPVKRTRVILDSSNSFYFADAFLKKAESMGIEVHSVLHSGSFEYRLTNPTP